MHVKMPRGAAVTARKEELLTAMRAWVDCHSEDDQAFERAAAEFDEKARAFFAFLYPQDRTRCP